MNYEQFKNQLVSEKIVLAEIYANELSVGFNLVSGSVYKKSVDFVVIGVTIDNVEQDQVSSLGAMASGKFYFSNKEVYIWGTGDVKLTYKITLSNIPKILPYDLSNGFEVEWEARILSTSQFGHDLDSDQIGTALQGQGSINLINTDGFFDQYYETINFENVNIYSYNELLPVTEAKKIFAGNVVGKQFSSNEVRLELADFISQLNSDIILPRFNSNDGVLPASFINQPKRRIYGRVSGLKCVPVDCILEGFSGSGSLVGIIEETIINGIGTDFLNELSPDDEIQVNDATYKIKSVISSTQIELTTAIESNIAELSYKINPKIPYRQKNRRWFIAHHNLKKISATITSIPFPNRLNVSTVSDFAVGDKLYINAESVTVRRISGLQIVLEQNLNTIPSIGDTVYKYPIQSVKDSFREFVQLRDYALAYNGDNALVEFDELAEFNISKEFPFVGSATFTNGSRIVTGTATSFDTDFKTRDWIKVDSTLNWYEILSIDSPTQLTLRSVFTQSTVTSIGQKKNISFLNDESSILVNCYGKTENGLESGVWIKSGASIIKDVLSEVGVTNLNTSSFYSSQIMSIKLPISYASSDIPNAKAVIDLVNKSILGSVFLDDNFDVKFDYIDSKKPANTSVIFEDDVISWSVETDEKDIVGEFICQYRHEDYDPITGQDSSSYKSRVNAYSRDFLGIAQTRTEQVYLYDETEAQEITQRYALLNELPKTKVVLTTSLNLQDKQINDRLVLAFDRMFYRKGSVSRYKVFIINSIKKDGYNTYLVLDDLGGIFDRVANIAANTSSVYSSASEIEQALNGYITDESGLITGFGYTNRINVVG
jgi:hypothetical protein